MRDNILSGYLPAITVPEQQKTSLFLPSSSASAPSLLQKKSHEIEYIEGIFTVLDELGQPSNGCGLYGDSYLRLEQTPLFAYAQKFRGDEAEKYKSMVRDSRYSNEASVFGNAVQNLREWKNRIQQAKKEKDVFVG